MRAGRAARGSPWPPSVPRCVLEAPSHRAQSRLGAPADGVLRPVGCHALLRSAFPWPVAVSSLVGSNGGVPAQSFGQFQVVLPGLAIRPVVGGGDRHRPLRSTRSGPVRRPTPIRTSVVDCVHKTGAHGITRRGTADAVFTILGGSTGGAMRVDAAGRRQDLRERHADPVAHGFGFRSGRRRRRRRERPVGVARRLSAQARTSAARTTTAPAAIGANDLSLWLGDVRLGNDDQLRVRRELPVNPRRGSHVFFGRG